MKKTFLFVVLIALICVVLCGCTPTDTSSGKSDSDVSLPTLNAEPGESGEAPVGSEPASRESDADLPQVEPSEKPDADPQKPDADSAEPTSVSDGTDDTTEPSVDESEDVVESEDVFEPEDEPDLQVDEEYVVDGGDGFGIGGN